MDDPKTAPEVARLRTERDLYKRLLELGAQGELDPFLRDSLQLIVELTGAQQGYLELYDAEGGPPRWWIAVGFSPDEVACVRSRISSGIVAKALSTGETIVTPSAMLDPEFRGFDSVQLGKIEAVLCAPIGAETPIGALYLQGRECHGLFDQGERTLARTFARHVAPLADRLIGAEAQRTGSDPTAPYRAKLSVESVVGRSRALANVLEEIALAAPLDVSVLFTGDNGTGKSQLAAAIHANSRRASNAFIDVNCAALPEPLIESELFGALPGAFTGASRHITGKVEAAEGGTLFLDEISEIPLASQAKLLQLLQNKTYYRLGSSESSTADVRIIAATNIDLEDAVKQRLFREDLYYRLNVLRVRVPSLDQRREDIRLLLLHFTDVAIQRHNLPPMQVSVGALRAAEHAEWPGNVRQLAHVAEVAAIRSAGEHAAAIEARHLFPEASPATEPGAMTLQAATRSFQAGFLKDRLDENDWNILKTAEELDVARSHLYNLVKIFHLKR